MSYEEKGVWVQLVVAVVAYGIYVAIVLGRADGGALADVAYAGTLLWTIGASIVAAIVARIAVEIVRPSDSHRRDARDREIDRFGEYAGLRLLMLGALAALGMALAGWDHFWIANVIYLGFVLSAVVAAAVKVTAYRRGL